MTTTDALNPTRAAAAAESALPLVISIDDHRAVGTMLQLAGRRTTPPCTVVTALNGTEGLALVAAHAATVRLVVLDVRMPDLDGRWVCSEIRRLAPHAQILPYTADPEAGLMMERFGALPPLRKPQGEQALASALGSALAVATPPPAPDPDLAAFFREQAAQQAWLAQQRGPAIRVALLANAHLCFALRTAVPLAGGVVVLETNTMTELRQQLTRQVVQVVLTTPEYAAAADALGADTHTPVLICAPPEQAARVPDPANVLAAIQDRALLSTVLCTLAAGGCYREIPARHPALAQLDPRAQEVVALLRAGHTLTTLSAVLGVSYDHIRHVVRALYPGFGVRSFRALQTWLEQHP